jgi:hypothetical protein
MTPAKFVINFQVDGLRAKIELFMQNSGISILQYVFLIAINCRRSISPSSG